MNPITEAVVYSLIAGATIPFGGFLAHQENIRPQWLEKELRHTIIAFGGGILLAAISLVLVPEGTKHLSLPWVIITFSAGGLCFFGIDMWIERRGGSVSQLMAMMLDFIPESMALGALITQSENTALLLAILIAFQNLPESFNAYREIRSSSSLSATKILIVFSLLVLTGPLSALLGISFLSDQPVFLSAIMLFSAGGILYLIFQDISPQVKLKNHWSPPLGAIAGYLVGIISEQVLS